MEWLDNMIDWLNNHAFAVGFVLGAVFACFIWTAV